MRLVLEAAPGSWSKAMEPNLTPMYDPRRVNITHPKPDSTVPSPPGAENKVEAANESTLADLASSEISLDLQVIIVADSI